MALQSQSCLENETFLVAHKPDTVPGDVCPMSIAARTRQHEDALRHQCNSKRVYCWSNIISSVEVGIAIAIARLLY
jgi:hypothetical protein